MTALLPWWWRWAALGLIVAFSFGYGYWKGDEHGTEKLTDYKAEQAKEAVLIVTKQGAVTEREVVKYIKVKGETEVVTRTVKERVTEYANANPSLCLTRSWGLLHDAAAANTVPAAGSGVDGTVGAPKAATALATVTDNYAACHRTADRLDALQGFVRGQYQATNGKPLGY